jgi:hypothetical protein
LPWATAGVLVTPLMPSMRHFSTSVDALAGEIFVSRVWARELPGLNP